MLSWVEHETSFITSGPGLAGVQVLFKFVIKITCFNDFEMTLKCKHRSQKIITEYWM